MGLVVLNPESLSNPSAMYRVVRFDQWVRYMDGESSRLDVVHEARTSVEAYAYAAENNGS